MARKATLGTALVLKNIPRDDFESMQRSPKSGCIAEAFDRVTVLRRRTFSCGNVQYICRTEKGEKFAASDTMIQLDK